MRECVQLLSADATKSRVKAGLRIAGIIPQSIQLRAQINVGEPRLVSQVGRVGELVCEVDQGFSEVRAVQCDSIGLLT